MVISLFQHESVSIGIAVTTAVLIVDLASTAVINMMFVQDRKLWQFVWVVPILGPSLLLLLIHSCLTPKFCPKKSVFQSGYNSPQRA
jgi:hypothetical protein